MVTIVKEIDNYFKEDVRVHLTLRKKFLSFVNCLKFCHSKPHRVIVGFSAEDLHIDIEMKCNYMLLSIITLK